MSHKRKKKTENRTRSQRIHKLTTGDKTEVR